MLNKQSVAEYLQKVAKEFREDLSQQERIDLQRVIKLLKSDNIDEISEEK